MSRAREKKPSGPSKKDRPPHDSGLTPISGPKGPPCANHPEREAHAACERCGAFSCKLCLRELNQGLCSDCTLRRLREEQQSGWNWLYNPQSKTATVLLLLLLFLPVAIAFTAWLAMYFSG